MLETERLVLMPLNQEQLRKYIRSDNSLEMELNLLPSQRIISAELKEAFEETILPNVAYTSKNYLYSTLWTIIDEENRQMLGDLCFFGEPNAAAEIEIGYGTYEVFQNNGFMTAVAAIVAWTKTNFTLGCMIAHTEKTNIASFSVLKKIILCKLAKPKPYFSGN